MSLSLDEAGYEWILMKLFTDDGNRVANLHVPGLLMNNIFRRPRRFSATSSQAQTDLIVIVV